MSGIAVENPASGETIATVPELGADEVRAMVDAARAAQPGWEALGLRGPRRGPARGPRSGWSPTASAS